MASAHVPADGPPLRRCRPPGEARPHFRRIFRPAFSGGFAGGACCRLPVRPAISARIFSRKFFTKKTPGNSCPFSADVSRRCLSPPIAGGCLCGSCSPPVPVQGAPRWAGQNRRKTRGEVFLCARYSFLEDYIFTPPIVPQNRLFPVKSPKNSPQILCKKSSPRPPLGGLGERFSGS